MGSAIGFLSRADQGIGVFWHAITPNDDPNFFEKVFSSVRNTRKIVFSYGDMNLPTFIYKNEQAIITDIKTTFDIKTSVITYTVSAVSSAALAASGTYTFINQKPVKPSEEIKRILYNKNYGLQEIFYGMNNQGLVEQLGLIAGDDKEVIIDSKTNINILDYLIYLVSCMQPASANSKTVKQKDIYILTIHDGINNSNDGMHDTSELGGPYFKVSKTAKSLIQADAYEIDIGYPTANIVTDFQISNNENFSIYYDWQKKLNNEEYATRLNLKGEEELVYAPIISSRNNEYRTKVSDQTWWTKVTEYPITVTLTIKGLLRPAILMNYVRLKVYFWGWKHVSSGLYIVTRQEDTIGINTGYRTTLTLTRISGDDSGELEE